MDGLIFVGLFVLLLMLFSNAATPPPPPTVIFVQPAPAQEGPEGGGCLLGLLILAALTAYVLLQPTF